MKGEVVGKLLKITLNLMGYLLIQSKKSAYQDFYQRQGRTSASMMEAKEFCQFSSINQI